MKVINKDGVMHHVLGTVIQNSLTEKFLAECDYRPGALGKMLCDAAGIESFKDLYDKAVDTQNQSTLLVVAIIKRVKQINDDLYDNGEDSILSEEDLLDKRLKNSLKDIKIDISDIIKAKIPALIKKSNEDVEKAIQDEKDALDKLEGEELEYEDDEIPEETGEEDTEEIEEVLKNKKPSESEDEEDEDKKKEKDEDSDDDDEDEDEKDEDKKDKKKDEDEEELEEAGKYDDQIKMPKSATDSDKAMANSMYKLTRNEYIAIQEINKRSKRNMPKEAVKYYRTAFGELYDQIGPVAAFKAIKRGLKKADNDSWTFEGGDVVGKVVGLIIVDILATYGLFALYILMAVAINTIFIFVHFVIIFKMAYAMFVGVDDYDQDVYEGVLLSHVVKLNKHLMVDDYKDKVITETHIMENVHNTVLIPTIVEVGYRLGLMDQGQVNKCFK